MNTMKILTTLIVSSAVAVGGYYSWNKPSQPQPIPAHPLPAQPVAPDSGQPTTPDFVASANLAPLSPDSTPATKADPNAIVFEASELITAVEQGLIQATIQGNGRERIVAQLRNNSPTPLRLTVPAGQVFEGGRSSVINLRAATIELMPAQSTEVTLQTAALLSTNKVADAPYKLSYQYISRMAPFVAWLAEHPEITAPAAQSAILSLMENLPASALAKFAPANGIPGRADTEAFRVDTSDLIGALTALRECGARVESLALANDSQLKLELMIEPLTREAAKRFYGITEETEWEFWKHELLQGDPSTRHYALFGIARFYPEIALEMLPKWVREAKTHPVYRLSAIQAIADTQKPEALSVLRQLASELGAETQLGKAATQAATFLDERLGKRVEIPVVAFRAKPTAASEL
jgi:hypothetical protein